MKTTKLTYYNGIMWHTLLLPDGARAVWPTGLDGRPLPGATTRYYRKPARAADREPALVPARG